jgi:hypothetical protein
MCAKLRWLNTFGGLKKITQVPIYTPAKLGESKWGFLRPSDSLSGKIKSNPSKELPTKISILNNK